MFIIATHDLEVAKKADRVVYLREGKIEREEVIKSELFVELQELL